MFSNKASTYTSQKTSIKRLPKQCCIIRFTGNQMLRIILYRDFPRRISLSNVKPLVVSWKQGLFVFGLHEIDPPQVPQVLRLLHGSLRNTGAKTCLLDAGLDSLQSSLIFLIGVYQLSLHRNLWLQTPHFSHKSRPSAVSGEGMPPIEEGGKNLQPWYRVPTPKVFPSCFPGSVALLPSCSRAISRIY